MAHSVTRYFRLMHLKDVRPSNRLWCPAADIYKSRQGWIVKVDLAGVKQEDIEIQIEGSVLRLSGIRRDTFFDRGVDYHQLEITYSRFEKNLRFPCSIEGARLSRDYNDGLLIIELVSEIDCDDLEDQ